MQYLVEVEMQLIVDSDLGGDDLAENMYAWLSELAYSEDHLLELSVYPQLLPPAIDSEPLDSGDSTLQQE